ncbi:MAG: hypothetical protein ACR2IS_11430, partial [Nitrososphaeraceae archaeon]
SIKDKLVSQMGSTKYFSDQTTGVWNSDDKRFSNPIYQRTKIGEHDHLHLTVENSVFRRCLRGNHQACHGFITTDEYKIRCSCLCQAIAEGLSACMKHLPDTRHLV